MLDIVAPNAFARAQAHMPAACLMRTSGLTFEAAGRLLIDDVTLSISQGRRTVIMGANGAGKSLTLRLLHGLIAPSGGKVIWKDRPLDRAARKAQAMVFQRPIMLRRTVLANLRFALGVRGVRGTECSERADEALRRARLCEVKDRPARVLSGGEQQRLAIARALACKPEILFLDEPTSNLDPASTLAIEELINEAHAGGVTIVMVTHDAGQARRIGDEAVFMHNGHVAEMGLIDDVLDNPISPAAQAWLEGRIFVEPPGASPR